MQKRYISTEYRSERGDSVDVFLLLFPVRHHASVILSNFIWMVCNLTIEDVGEGKWPIHQIRGSIDQFSPFTDTVVE